MRRKGKHVRLASMKAYPCGCLGSVCSLTGKSYNIYVLTPAVYWTFFKIFFLLSKEETELYIWKKTIQKSRLLQKAKILPMSHITSLIMARTVKCLLMCSFGISVGHSVEFQGELVAPGQKCADETILKINRHDYKTSEMDFMAQKWRTLFKSFDFNRDEMITNKDYEIFRNNFIHIYNLSWTIEANIISKQLNKFMHCVFFHGLQLSQGVSETMFLRLYRHAYESNKPATVKRLHRCSGYLLSVIDRYMDGLLSFAELFDNYKSWGLNSKELVQQMFRLMDPNIDNRVPVANYDEYYTELTNRNNRQQFADMTKAYSEAGFSV